MSRQPTRAEIKACRSQTFHVARLAAARTPAERVERARDRIRAVMDRSDEATAARIAGQAVEALTRIADVADAAATANPKDAVTPLPENAKPDLEAPPQGRGASLADRIRDRWKVPVITEETRGQPAKGARSPWREDLPSPRCVIEDYRAGAAHYGENAALAAGIYWVIAALPLAFSMAMAAGHVASQRPGRFWVFVVLVPALFTVCLIVFS